MLRIPEKIAEKAKQAAKKNHISYNTFVIHAVEEKLKKLPS